MSVIFGIKENNCVIIAADKRGSDIDGNLITDECEKITVINDHLAYASAGNAAIEKAIALETKKLASIEKLTTDDLHEVIRSFYNRVQELSIQSILYLPFCCVIAGKGSRNKLSLVSISCFRGVFSANEVPMVLWPPDKSVQQACINSFVSNYHLHHSDFAKRTVYDISCLSKLVSPSGNQWIYNFETDKGEYSSF